MSNKELILGLTVLVLLLSSNQAIAQVQNTSPGGIIISKINSTLSQYCFNGTCQTSNTIPVINASGNDTANLESKARYNIIMIIPSELCTRAIEYHLKTDCPPLENLTKYDNSNQNISGFFYSLDGKILERSNPQVKNHWQYYRYTNHTITCVYCTGNYITTDLYKTIIIESPTFEYVPHNFITRTETNYIQNGTGYFIPITTTMNELDAGLRSYIGRSMQGCDTATISYSDFLLNDTIHYMESGCKVTSYNKTNTQIVPNTPWVYDNPYSSLHYMSALKDMTKGHGIYGTNQTVGGHGPGNCINGCSYTTSTKKPGW